VKEITQSAGEPRLPLTEPDKKSKAVIEQTLKSYKIDLPIAARA
jgi:hypothetical protein